MLTRRVRVGDQIRITQTGTESDHDLMRLVVLAVKGGTLKLGFEAPDTIAIEHIAQPQSGDNDVQ